MSSCNFGENYLTEHSYQVMDGDIVVDREVVLNELDEALDYEIRLTDTFHLRFEVDELFQEVGYFSGYRVEPLVSLFLYHNDIELERVVLEYAEDTTTYLECVAEYIGYNFNVDMFSSIEQDVRELFSRVDNILSTYYDKYTTGWCSSIKE